MDTHQNLGPVSSHFPIRSKLLLSITPLSLLSWQPHGPCDSVCNNRCQIRLSEWGHILRLLPIWGWSPKNSLAENCIISMAVKNRFIFFSYSLCGILLRLVWKVVGWLRFFRNWKKERHSVMKIFLLISVSSLCKTWTYNVKVYSKCNISSPRHHNGMT